MVATVVPAFGLDMDEGLLLMGFGQVIHIGKQEIKCWWAFDIMVYLTRKAWLLEGGHATDSSCSNFLFVVTRIQ